MTKKKLEKELSKDPTVNHIEDIDNPEYSYGNEDCSSETEATGILPKIDFEPDQTTNINETVTKRKHKRFKPINVLEIVLLIAAFVFGFWLFTTINNFTQDYSKKIDAVFEEIEDTYNNIDRVDINDESTREEISGYIFDLNKVDKAIDKLQEQNKLKEYNRFDGLKKKLSKEILEANNDAKKVLGNRINSIKIDDNLFNSDGTVKSEASIGDKQDYIDLFNEVLNLANDIIIIQDKTGLYDSEEYSKISSELINNIEMSSKLCQEAMTREALSNQSQQLSKENQQKLDDLNKRFEKSIEELNNNIKSLEETIAQKDSTINELETKLQGKQ